MQKEIIFKELKTADLFLDALYKGGTQGNTSADALSKLLGCGNQGGFRYLGRANKPKFLVLYSSQNDIDWPDYLDIENGLFYYYGDNKKPGHDLHDTPRKGNLILKNLFDNKNLDNKSEIPPIFIFTKAGKGRDVIFRGLAIPGNKNISTKEELIAIWKSTENQRFQNYRSTFTILDISKITREWIKDIQNGNPFTDNAPEKWINWIQKNKEEQLISKKTSIIRTKDEQIPNVSKDIKLIRTIYDFFTDPYEFEKFAVDIVKLMDKNIVDCDLTRPWRDGGRDAVGKYRIGLEENSLLVDFALEAKRYGLNNSVGVKEVSRLISRLRYRQFGIIVTTSFLHSQAYKEIKEDKHPVVIICANDILKILKQNNINNKEKLLIWLNNNFR